jgi:hypothetical protein
MLPYFSKSYFKIGSYNKSKSLIISGLKRKNDFYFLKDYINLSPISKIKVKELIYKAEKLNVDLYGSHLKNINTFYPLALFQLTNHGELEQAKKLYSKMRNYYKKFNKEVFNFNGINKTIPFFMLYYEIISGSKENNYYELDRTSISDIYNMAGSYFYENLKNYSKAKLAYIKSFEFRNNNYDLYYDYHSSKNKISFPKEVYLSWAKRAEREKNSYSAFKLYKKLCVDNDLKVISKNRLTYVEKAINYRDKLRNKYLTPQIHSNYLDYIKSYLLVKIQFEKYNKLKNLSPMIESYQKFNPNKEEADAYHSWIETAEKEHEIKLSKALRQRLKEIKKPFWKIW